MSILKYDHNGVVATITLANPPQNRLSRDVLLAFREAIEDIADRSETRVIHVRSEGPDFSFGGDITPWVGLSEAEATRLIKEGLDLCNAFEQLPVPSVVEVQGHCLGGGFELALRGDIIVAADDAKFGHPETTIGIFTLLGGVQRVAERVGRTRAIQWALTGELISARHAHSIGLINDYVPRDVLQATTEAWVDRLAKGATRAHATHKQLLSAWSTGGPGIGRPDDACVGRANFTHGGCPGQYHLSHRGLASRPASPFLSLHRALIDSRQIATIGGMP